MTQSFSNLSTQIIVKIKVKLLNNPICENQINSRVLINQPKLNEEKIEFFIAGTARQLFKVICESLNVVNIDSKESTRIKGLGVMIDRDLSLKEQVNAFCRSCDGYLKSDI